MIKFINPQGITNTDIGPTLYVRAILDHDGELRIEGDTDEEFDDPIDIGWFTVRENKLRFVYAECLDDTVIGDFIHLTNGHIVCA